MSKKKKGEDNDSDLSRNNDVLSADNRGSVGRFQSQGAHTLIGSDLSSGDNLFDIAKALSANNSIC